MFGLTGSLKLLQLSDDSTSAQSLSSLLQLNEDFLRTVLVLMNDETTPTPVHVARANAHLGIFENVPVEHRRIGSEIDSLRILREMLNNAPSDRGKRYVACAVICCDYHEQKLVRLASDWVHFLLWPFKSAYKRRSPSFPDDSIITPPESEEWMIVKDPLFRDLLKERQANQCVVIECPPGFRISTISAQIIRRSIAQLNNSNAGLPTSSATWDILRHYADLSEDTIQDLANIIDSPSNGILLQVEMHDAFDDFDWCLEATNEPNVYNVKWLTETPRWIWAFSGFCPQVRFTDHSEKGDIPLPNAQFLSIHAAIAKVLYFSGASKPLDLVLDRFDSGSFSPAPSGKYGSADLGIRWPLLDLFRDLTHLPAEIPTH